MVLPRTANKNSIILIFDLLIFLSNNAVAIPDTKEETNFMYHFS